MLDLLFPLRPSARTPDGPSTYSNRKARTATRTSEVLHAQWSEFDLEKAIWTIGAERMKAGREHRVPLSPAAVSLLRDLEGNAGFVFPGQSEGKPLSNMAMEMCLRRMGVAHYTVHGFRSSFRDWVGEETTYPREIAEQALAHVVGSATERSYRRGDSFQKRVALMGAWSDYCSVSARVSHEIQYRRP